ncbi:hypothetical protein QYF36_009869 [Acer negundo]|nr:hypothetical protein QYF36_009869 [Acer negundo]
MLLIFALGVLRCSISKSFNFLTGCAISEVLTLGYSFAPIGESYFCMLITVSEVVTFRYWIAPARGVLFLHSRCVVSQEGKVWRIPVQIVVVVSAHSPVDRMVVILQTSPVVLTAFWLSLVVSQEGKVLDRRIPVQTVLVVSVHSPVDRTTAITFELCRRF